MKTIVLFWLSPPHSLWQPTLLSLRSLTGPIQAKIHLPDAKQGFYRGTRFDWSGVIYSLSAIRWARLHYGPWFSKTNPSIHDFIYQGDDIVAGPCSAITGPVDEFKPLGFDDAKPGGTFIKIGIGALRKPDECRVRQLPPLRNRRSRQMAHQEKARFHSIRPDAFKDSSSGFAYVYSKTLQLTNGKPEMLLRHSLKNTGTHAIKTSVYNHNFLVLDAKPPGPGVSITVPFQIQSPHPPNPNLAEIRGNQIIYLNTLKDRDTVATPLQGFSDSFKDNQIRIESTSAGAGMTIQSDRPLLSESLWSIRTVLAMEPFIAISIEPGQEFTWTSTYEYYTK